jgi:ATP-dependent DNA helicase RecQ
MTDGCRQLEILDYFGDPNRETCSTCDNCARPPRKKAGTGGPGGPAHSGPSDAATNDHHSAKILTAIRMVLSGVARAKGRFGRLVIARMLIGSKAKQIAKLGLDKLSTFGLLASLNESEASALIDALVHAGLLQLVEEVRFRPLIRLTPRGEEVMKGKVGFDAPLPINGHLKVRLAVISAKAEPRGTPAAGGR